MKVLVMLVVVMSMGCALDEEYNNYGSWESSLYSLYFISETILIVEFEDEKILYTYCINNKHIYIEKNGCFIDYFRVIKWDNESLIIRDQNTSKNYKLYD